LSKKWRVLKAAGIEPANYPRRPDIYWSRKNHLTKLKELEDAKKMTGVEAEAQPQQLSRRRKIGVKTRL
jgi:hypothetical protein